MGVRVSNLAGAEARTHLQVESQRLCPLLQDEVTWIAITIHAT
jgi:hypothetical protein